MTGSWSQKHTSGSVQTDRSLWVWWEIFWGRLKYSPVYRMYRWDPFREILPWSSMPSYSQSYHKTRLPWWYIYERWKYKRNVFYNSNNQLVDGWGKGVWERWLAHQSGFQHLLKDGQFMDSDGVGVYKQKLIASSFLLNVYSTCDRFAINRYTVTALIHSLLKIAKNVEYNHGWSS